MVRSNFYWIIIGWDGLGVVSFLLIVFYMRTERSNNGLFTLFQNRVGDLFFIFFIVELLDLVIVGNLILSFRVFIILGAVVKRAQYPFNS